MQAIRGDFLLSSDPELLDFDVVHGFLSQAYWSAGIPRALVEQAAKHSRPYGLYHCPGVNARRQAGYMRLITDFTATAYVSDVFVLEEFRGRGLAKWMVGTVLADPLMREVRSWMLGTRDAHELYRQFGFGGLDDPRRFMRRAVPPSWRVESPA